MGLTPNSAHAASKQVLVILSGADHIELQDRKTFRTGFYLNELMIPVKQLREAGYALTYATPDGHTPALDASSDDPKYFTSKEEYTEHRKLLDDLRILDPKSGAVVTLDAAVGAEISAYAGVFVPGGHAPLADLSVSERVGRALTLFHKAMLPTALICHGPVALLSTVRSASHFITAVREGRAEKAAALARSWPYRGYRLAVFSTPEEQQAETRKLGGKVLWYPDTMLAAAGAQLKVGPPWKPNVVRDRELLTGQNPASDRELVKQFIAMLKSGS